MDGRTNACQWSGGRQCWTCSSACPWPVPLDQHRLPVTLDRAAAARMLSLPASCGLQNQIKASTQGFQIWHCTAETGPDLFASICRICQKICKNIYAEHDQNYACILAWPGGSLNLKSTHRKARTFKWFVLKKGLKRHCIPVLCRSRPMLGIA